MARIFKGPILQTKFYTTRNLNNIQENEMDKNTVVRILNEGTVEEKVLCLQSLHKNQDPQLLKELFTQIQEFVNSEDIALRFWAKKIVGIIESFKKKAATEEAQTMNNLQTLLERLQAVEHPLEKIEIVQKILTLRDTSSIAPLIDLLKTTTEPTLIAYLVKNIAINLPDEKLIPDLMPFLKSSDDRVVANAIEGLEAIKSPKTIALLVQLTTSHNNRIRANAAKAIRSFDKNQSTQVLCKMLEMNDSPHFVISACATIGYLREPSFLPHLIEKITQPLIAKNALNAIEAIGGEQAIVYLEAIVEDCEESIKSLVSETITRLKSEQKKEEIGRSTSENNDFEQMEKSGPKNSEIFNPTINEMPWQEFLQKSFGLNDLNVFFVAGLTERNKSGREFKNWAATEDNYRKDFFFSAINLIACLDKQPVISYLSAAVIMERYDCVNSRLAEEVIAEILRLDHQIFLKLNAFEEHKRAIEEKKKEEEKVEANSDTAKQTEFTAKDSCAFGCFLYFFGALFCPQSLLGFWFLLVCILVISNHFKSLKTDKSDKNEIKESKKENSEHKLPETKVSPNKNGNKARVVVKLATQPVNPLDQVKDTEQKLESLINSVSSNEKYFSNLEIDLINGNSQAYIEYLINSGLFAPITLKMGGFFSKSYDFLKVQYDSKECLNFIQHKIICNVLENLPSFSDQILGLVAAKYSFNIWKTLLELGFSESLSVGIMLKWLECDFLSSQVNDRLEIQAYLPETHPRKLRLTLPSKLKENWYSNVELKSAYCPINLDNDEEFIFAVNARTIEFGSIKNLHEGKRNRFQNETTNLNGSFGMGTLGVGTSVGGLGIGASGTLGGFQADGVKNINEESRTSSENKSRIEYRKFDQGKAIVTNKQIVYVGTVLKKFYRFESIFSIALVDLDPDQFSGQEIPKIEQFIASYGFAFHSQEQERTDYCFVVEKPGDFITALCQARKKPCL